MKLIISLLTAAFMLTSLGTAPVIAQSTSNNSSPCGTTYVVQPKDYLFKIAQTCDVSYSALVAANPQIQDPSLIYPGEVVYIPQGNTTGGIPVTGGSVYIVQPGDTFASVASHFNISVSQLQQANPFYSQLGTLYPGSVLTLPQGTQKVPTISVSPISGKVGDTVTVAVTGFSANVPVLVGFGLKGQIYYQIDKLNTDANGAIYKQYQIPNWANANGQYAFVVQRVDNPNIRAVSNGFSIGPSGTTGIPVTGQSTYVVQPGDTLSGIASRFNTSVAALLALNPAIDQSQLIYSGQILRLSGSTSIPVTGGPAVGVSEYVANPGDVLSVRAVDFPVGAHVDIRIGRANQEYVEVKDAVVDSQGVVTGSVTVPTWAVTGQEWTVRVRTTDRANGVNAISQPITITGNPSSSAAYIGVSDLTPAPGDTITVKAGNFPANAHVDVRLAQQGQPFTAVVDAQANSQGTVEATIQVPTAAKAGQQWVAIVTTTDRRNGVTVTSQPMDIQ